MSAIVGGTNRVDLPNEDGMVQVKRLCAEVDKDSNAAGVSETPRPASSTWSRTKVVATWKHGSYYGMRTSCDYCGRRKRKCDGEGTQTCRLVFQIAIRINLL